MVQATLDWDWGEGEPTEDEEENDWQLLEKLKTVKERVEHILQNHPEARNSDLYLTILYLRKFTELGKYIKYIPYNVIKKYDGIFESIRRSRQKLQEEGKYPPTDPEVLRRRRRLAEKFRRVIPRL